ncbi:MAG: hypothetical protein IT319_15775 [Anaerolineae bacterium]|nr:hypothetical protein [Anaerolineae bacterium]
MAGTWLKYKNNDNAAVIFNLDRATHFRHIADGDESFVEVYAEGTMHSIMRLTDPEAYRVTMNYIAMTTGYTLEA